MMATAQTIVGIFFIADRDVFIWVSLIMFCVSIALVALLVRRRSWPEMICIFFLIFAGTMGLTHLIFKHIVDVPFFKTEAISMTTNDR